MAILLACAALLGGLVLLTIGADRLLSGAVALARRARLSEAVIGATIVAGGTSLPELVASLSGALAGQFGLAVGNVVGSNICNVGGILGPVALIAPMTAGREVMRRDWWVMAAVSVALVAMAWASTTWVAADPLLPAVLPRAFCLLLIVGFAGYAWWSVRSGSVAGEEHAGQPPPMRLWLALAWVLVGAVLLAIGGDILVWGAVRLAHGAGISDAVIGLTVVAFGTSAPELMTSLLAAKRGQTQLAVANVVGSSTFNILLILGVTGSVGRLPVEAGILHRDLFVMLAFALVLPLLWGRAGRIGRSGGIVLTLGYAAYLMLLVVQTVRG